MQISDKQILSKRAQTKSTEFPIGVILLILVIVIVIVLVVIFSPKLKDFLNNLPGFNNTRTDTNVNPGGIDNSGQTSETFQDDICIGKNLGKDFYWSDKEGKSVLSYKLAKEDPAYIAITFNDDFVKYPQCGNYVIQIRALEDPSFVRSENFGSLNLFGNEAIKSLNGQKFYIVPFSIKSQDPYWSGGLGWWRSNIRGSRAYTFLISSDSDPNKIKKTIRAGNTINVK